MFLNLIGALLKESGALDAVQGYLVSALAAAQLKSTHQRVTDGNQDGTVAATLRAHFLQSDHLSLMQRRMLGAGWQQGLSAPRNGKEFWGFCSDGVIRTQWSTLAGGFVALGQPDRELVDLLLWLPLSALPDGWTTDTKRWSADEAPF